MSVCTPKSFDLTGKVALVTGASYGIGFAIATAMANCGATIVLNDIKQELVDKGLAAYKEAGINAHGYVCDVTNEDAVNEMVKKITEEVGHINVLVNNAGIIKRIPMIEMTAAQLEPYVEDVLDTFLQAITTRKVKNLPQYMKSLLWTSFATYKLNTISGITAPYKEVKNVYGLH